MRAIKNKKYLQLFPDVYQLNIGASNIVLIVEDKLTLIDTGLPGSSARITEFVNSLGRSIEEISLIIITHNHIDHAGGLAELRRLTGARVAAHKDDLNDAEYQEAYPGFIRRLLQIPSVSDLHSRFVLKPGEIDIHLEGGEVLEPLGGLEVIHTPGHTMGSICLYSPEYKLLIASDALTRRGIKPRPPRKSVSSNYPLAIESIKKLASLDIGILCIGHRRPLTSDIGNRMKELIRVIEFDNNRHK